MITAPPLVEQAGVHCVYIYEEHVPLIRECHVVDLITLEIKLRYDARVNGTDVTYVPAKIYDKTEISKIRREAYDWFKQKEVETWTTSLGAAL